MIWRYYEALGKAYAMAIARDEAVESYRKAMQANPKKQVDMVREIKRVESYPPGETLPYVISDSCIVLGTPRPTNIGCGDRRVWYFTPVSVKKSQDCPSSIEIEYIEPSTGKPEGWTIPDNNQTCGGGITQAKVRDWKLTTKTTVAS